MTEPAGMPLAVAVLAAAGGLNEAIHAGVVARGFTDVRPAHGYAFTRLAGPGATVGELASHLGVTKQAASQLVEELTHKGYVRAGPHPDDARSRLVTLTGRGVACTRAAEAAADDAVAGWVAVLGAERVGRLQADLARVARPGRLRPSW